MSRFKKVRDALLIASALTAVPAIAQTVPIPAGPTPPTPPVTTDQGSSSAATSPLSNSAVTRTGSAESPSATETDGTIVVTGSRIVANGYKAPTPVTVVGTTELLKKAPESLAAGLQTLPQFFQTSGSNVTSSQARNTNAGNYLNLRGLGEIETLLLLDGQRLPPTSYAGTTDANIIPQALVQRVDVVTGGASAAYGSDAVAGVVNFILDTKFNGVKASGQYGISGRGDDHQWKFGVAVGHSFADDRLHVEASFDYFYQPGIVNNGQRPYGGNYTGGWVDVGAFAPGTGTNTVANGCKASGCAAGTQQNPYTPMFNVRLANATYGTLINSGRTASQAANRSGSTPFSLVGYTFSPSDGYYKADLGTPTGTPNFNIGGADTSVSFGTTLTSKLETKQGFGRIDYDLGGGTSAFLQGSYTDSKVEFVTVGAGTQFNSFQIFSDNAFLPTGVSQAMQKEGVAAFVASRVEADQTPKRAFQDNQATTVLGGVKGMLGNFNWSVTGSYGDSTLDARHTGNFQQARWFAALDAVRDGNGNIVCRVTITNPGLYPGCVPWNPFGNGSPSKASYAYFEDVSTFHIVSRQSDVAANLSGGLFDLPAGTVNIAVGGEYRHQYLNVTSNNDPSMPIDLTGLRGASGDFNLLFNSTNQGKSFGSQDVEEGYTEVAIPILRDTPFFQSLDLNAAARYTNYSVSGGIWAWKAGFSWVPVDQLRFRGTISRDIRAPTLNELFAGVSSTRGTFNDVHTNRNTNIITLQQGNPNLKPEKGDTITLGAIWQPDFVPGFSVSLDYYHIKIKDRITTLSTTDLNQRCEDSGGTDVLCQFINRPFPFANRDPENFPITISQVPFNQAALVTYGFDYEINYRIPMGTMFNSDPAKLDLRIIGNHTPSLVSVSGPGATPLVLDGTLSGGGTGIPRDKITASAQLTEGSLSFGFDLRFIGPMKYTKQPNVFVTNNNLAAAAYLNANISYDVDIGGHPITLFMTGTNLTDHFVFAPRLNAQPTEFYPSFQSVYDVVGRYFVFGARAKF